MIIQNFQVFVSVGHTLSGNISRRRGDKGESLNIISTRIDLFYKCWKNPTGSLSSIGVMLTFLSFLCRLDRHMDKLNKKITTFDLVMEKNEWIIHKIEVLTKNSSPSKELILFIITKKLNDKDGSYFYLGFLGKTYIKTKACTV